MQHRHTPAHRWLGKPPFPALLLPPHQASWVLQSMQSPGKGQAAPTSPACLPSPPEEADAFCFFPRDERERELRYLFIFVSSASPSGKGRSTFSIFLQLQRQGGVGGASRGGGIHRRPRPFRPCPGRRSASAGKGD